MLIQPTSQLYTFSQPKISTNNSNCQIDSRKLIHYQHTLRPSPEQYHTEAIKQYRKELDELRRNYYNLQKAYYYLLGYRGEFSEPLPLPDKKDGFNLCVTEVSQNNYPSSSMHQSSTSIYEAVGEIEQNKKRISKLSHSITDFEIETKAAQYLGIGLQSLVKPVHKQKVRTQYDEETGQNLIEAIKQIQSLKNAIAQTYETSEGQLHKIRLSYEQHIKQLEQILERQRKHTKMLNGVIKKQRTQIEAKEELIQHFMAPKDDKQDRKNISVLAVQD